MEVSELLWSALDIYRERGGGREVYVSGDTNEVCLVGALHEATRLLGYSNETCASAEWWLLDTTNDLFSSNSRPRSRWLCVEDFNDTETTTKEMCEQVLHKTALRVSEVVR